MMSKRINIRDKQAVGANPCVRPNRQARATDRHRGLGLPLLVAMTVLLVLTGSFLLIRSANAVTDNRYIQYRVYIETDDADVTPKVQGVTFTHSGYTPGQYVFNDDGGQSYSGSSLTGFAETLGSADQGGAGNITYQLSDDGTSWYYWDNSNWVFTSSNSNTASVVNANITKFDEDVGKGNAYFKAYLNTTGATQTELDRIDLTYEPDTLLITQPNGGEAWAVNSTKEIIWSTTSGNITNVKLEYSTDNFATPVTMAASTANDGSYMWSVAFAPSSTVKVRVSDVTDASINDISDEYFAIVSLYVTAPNGSESWKVGSVHNIEWTWIQGAAPSNNLSIFYSTDNFESSNTIATGEECDGVYSWTVADDISTTVKVRVQDADMPPVIDDSNNYFSIIESTLNITAPNGSEQWMYGKGYNITWTWEGLVNNNLTIEYSLDNFDSVAGTISTGEQNDGTYLWTIMTQDYSTTVKVQVRDLTRPTVTDISDNYFSLMAPTITVETPNGGESWRYGEGYNITWSWDGYISDNLKIEYSKDDFNGNINVIDTNVACSGSYLWTVPQDYSTTVKVRITDMNNSTVYDKSDEYFEITTPTITVNTPNGGESWIAGTAHDITWSSEGFINDSAIFIFYSLDNFQNQTNLEPFGDNDGVFTWTVPVSAMSNTVKVRVYDYLQEGVADDKSDDYFAITMPEIYIEAPNGGESWMHRTAYDITWTSIGTVSNNLTIEYSTDNFDLITNELATGQSANGSYLWTIPEDISTTVKVRITDQTSPNATQTSENYFAIIPMVIDILAPNGGENWRIKDTNNIQWTTTGLISNNLKIEYSTDNFYSIANLIVDNYANDLSYAWSIPEDVSSTVKVRITETTATTANDTSGAYFSIIPMVIDITAPNGGETWIRSDTENITWNTTGNISNNLKIEYSTDNFSSAGTLIADGYSNSGTYQWTIPFDVSSTVKVRVSDNNSASAVGTSGGYFQLYDYPTITVTAPNGGESWNIGTLHQITWDDAAIIDDYDNSTITIEYSTTDDFSSPVVIATGELSDGVYNWTVADDASSTVKVRVRDISFSAYSQASDTSNNYFSITIPEIYITQPNGGEQWVGDDTRNITWSWLGTVSDNLTIEYSTDNFSSPATEIATGIANNGTYAWSVASIDSTTVKVRITDANRTVTYGTSGGYFELISYDKLEIKTPNGGEVWRFGTTRDITWSSWGDETAGHSVNLEYSRDNFDSDVNAVSGGSGTENDGLFSWTIPSNKYSTTVKVRITDSVDGLVTDTSDEYFEIAYAGFHITAPNGGESWRVNSAYDIQWTVEGTVFSIDIDYSTDNFDSSNPIASSLSSSATSYTWTIPDDVSSTVKIRLKDTFVANANTTSGDYFSIIPMVIDIQTPNGGEDWVVKDSHDIAWSTIGNISDNLKIEVSDDDFQSPATLIADGYPNTTGVYTWTVTDLPGSTIKVRVSDNESASATGKSGAYFTITPMSITLLSPNGGESWIADVVHNITWTTESNLSDNIRIDYSVDNFDSVAGTIATGLAKDAGSYSWTVAAGINSSTVKIRVRDDQAVSATDISEGYFSVYDPSFTITSPNGGETWMYTYGYDITWTSSHEGISNNLKIEYSLDDFTGTPTLLASGISNSGTYRWTISVDEDSTTAKVRITDLDRPATANKSAYFEIIPIPALDVTSPNGSEVWKFGTAQNITWSYTSSVSSNLKIEYSKDNFQGTPVLIGDGISAAGTYTWTIPDDPSTTVKVRITDNNWTAAVDTSDNYFELASSTITVTAPNGGESWIAGTLHNITWTTEGYIYPDSLQIIYSTDNFQSVNNNIATWQSNDNVYPWTVPDDVSNTVKIKILDMQQPAAVVDSSDDYFAITTPQIYINQPSGGENWRIKNAYDIQWTSTGTINNNLTISYSTDNFASSTPIAVGYADTESYSWTIPEDVSSTVKVKITDQTNPYGMGQSADYFSIIPMVIGITQPNGGEVWRVNDPMQIQWTTTGNISNDLKIEYSLDNFQSSGILISDVEPNDWTYTWTVPEAVSSTVKVRISDNESASAIGTSDSYFQIIPMEIDITAPNGGETWMVSFPQNITWNKTGNLHNDLTIEYSTDNFASANTIATGYTSTSPYVWTIPDDVSATVKVKIYDASSSTATDTSGAYFEIVPVPDITLTAPNGGEAWVFGTTHNIEWTINSTVSNSLKIEYSKDNFDTPILIAADVGNTSPYTWTVPEDVSTTVKVRVTDNNWTTAYGQSGAYFAIASSSIVLSSPDGGEVWVGTDPHDIIWTTQGTVSNNLKIEYSLDNFSTAGVEIGSNETNDGVYPWIVPSLTTTTIKVRVMDMDRTNVYDISSDYFEIIGTARFDVYTPNGGESWKVGTTQNITWTSVGEQISNNLKIEYSKDNFETVAGTITGSTADDGLHPWVIPNDMSTTVKVRIRDNNNTAYTGQSYDYFEIASPTFDITSPTLGTEVWMVRTSYPITWTSEGTISTDLKLEYSLDNFQTTPVLIATGITNTGSYDWTIPEAPSSTVKVRITDNYRATATDTSDNYFTITPMVININAPNGGEEWYVTSRHNISWTTTGNLSDDLKIEYSTDNFQSPATLIAASVSNSGTYNWTIPDDLSTTVKVRVSDNTSASAVGSSGAYFSIMDSDITVTAPNGGEQWYVTTGHTITWTTTSEGVGETDLIRVQYSTDDFGPNTYTIASGLAGGTTSYSWTIPDDVSSTVKVRVQDMARLSTVDDSGADFSIMNPAVTLTSPNGGESWIVGTSHNITWTSTSDGVGITNAISLYYSKDDFGSSNVAIATGLANGTSSYTWTIPDDISTTVKVRVRDEDRTATYDKSDMDFSITTPDITVTSPNGGEQWKIGTLHNITWTSIGAVEDNLKIEYSTDGFTNIFNEIAGSVSDSGSYSWTVPDDFSSTVKVRITDNIRTPLVRDESGANFRIILPTVEVTAPNGGEVWIEGDVETITWTWEGAVNNNLTIQYSKDNFSSDVHTIATGEACDGSYSWTIPGDPDDTVWVKITDASRAGTTDTSDNSFDLEPIPVLTLTAPNGGESWVIGTLQTINWTSLGIVSDNLKIEYSTDNFTSSTTIGTSIADSGSYQWTVADDLSSTVKVKITDNNRTATTDQSGAYFDIAVPYFNITAPNGGETWVYPDTRNITWSSVGTILGTLLIEYSDDDFVWDVNEISNFEANDGSYAWSVPSIDSSTMKVRVTDNARAAATGKSGAYFNLLSYPQINIQSPNGGETWIVGNAYDIAWSSYGDSISNNISIEYSKDNFNTTGITIASSQQNDGVYRWTVPDDISDTVKIKVYDGDDTLITDTTGAYFFIKGAVTVTAPNGAESWAVRETHTITWTSIGTIGNVKLEYSTDDFASDINEIAASVSNSGSYIWTVADAIVNAGQDPQTDRNIDTKIRVSDASDASVYDISDNPFNCIYYTITWIVRDADDPDTALGQLNVYCTSGWEVTDNSLYSGVTHNYKYPPDPSFTYETIWSRTLYMNASSVWAADMDKTITIYMESSIKAQIVWKVYTQSAYDIDNDSMQISAWVEKRGLLQTTPTSCTITIYETDGALVTTLTSSSPDSNGVFWLDWDTTGMSGNKIYFAKCVIVHQGNTYTSGDGFNITIPEKLASIETDTDAILVDTASIIEDTGTTLPAAILTSQTSVESSISTAKTSIESKVSTAQTSIESKVSSAQTSIEGKVDTAQTGITAILEDTGTTLPAQISAIGTDVDAVLEDTGTTLPAAITSSEETVTSKIDEEVGAGILNRETSVKGGDTITIRYRTDSALSPLINVYNASNTQVVTNAAMTEIGTTGVYEYDLKLSATYGTGEFTIICSESTLGTMDSMTLSVLTTDLEAIASDASLSASKAGGDIEEVSAKVDSLETKINDISGKLSGIEEGIRGGGSEVAGAVNLNSIYDGIQTIVSELKNMSGESGYNMDLLYDVNEEEADNIDYLKNKTTELKQVIDVNRKLLDKTNNKPIIKTWMESGE